MVLGAIIGAAAGLFGGGGGSSSSVNYGVLSTIRGGDKPVGVDQTIRWGTTPLAVQSTVQGGDKPVALTSTIQGGTKEVGIDLGLDDVNLDLGGTERPLHTIAELRHPDTFKSETDIDLDVQPVQVDLCLNVGLTRLPRAHIRQPYDSHFAVTVLGTEMVGFKWRGESKTIIDELADRPHVEPGREVHRKSAIRAERRWLHRPEPTDGGGFHIRIG